jgi:hypothetical protein
MERLISADEKRGLSFRLEYGTYSPRHLLSPVFRRVFLENANVDHGRRFKDAISVIVSAMCDSIHPYHESRPTFLKGCPRLLRRTDKIRNCEPSGLNYLVAKPTHSSRMFGAILRRESEVSVDMMPDLVSVELHGV